MIDYKRFNLKLNELIDISSKILLVSHRNPDDDAVASLLGTYNYIIKQFKDKDIKIAIEGKFSKKWIGFNYFNKIESVENVMEESKKFDLVIFLDGNQYSRFSNYSSQVLEGNFKSVCIDHHASPPSEFDYSLIDYSLPANACVVYKLFYEDLASFEKSDAELILFGILGDTANFVQINFKQTDVFGIVKRILEIGEIDIQEYLNRYDGFSIEAYRHIGNPISNLKIVPERNGIPAFLCTYIDMKVFEALWLDDSIMNELAHIFMDTNLRKVNGYRWGFIMYPKSNGEIKFSARSSSNNVNVRFLCQDLGAYYGRDGGGHDLAAGCSLPMREESKIEMEKYFHEVLDLILSKKIKLMI